MREALTSWAAPDKRSVIVAAGLPVAFRDYDVIPSAVIGVLRHVHDAHSCQAVKRVPVKTFVSMCQGQSDTSWLSKVDETKGEELGELHSPSSL